MQRELQFDTSKTFQHRGNTINLLDPWNAKKSNGLSALDLYCGCGGLSLGFEKAGFEILAGIDNDNDSLETYLKNGISPLALNLDLSDPAWMDILETHLGKKKPDVVIAGPPCQGFSLTGPRQINDKRNVLYKAVLDSVSVWKPKAFLIENVKGMATLYGGQVKNDVKEQFSKIGYKVAQPTLLNSADFGIPQIRQRLFFVGTKNGLKEFNFPEPIFNKDDYFTCEEAISDLPSLEYDLGEECSLYPSEASSEFQKLIRNGSQKLFNHVGTNHADHVKAVIRQVPEGGNYKDLPEGIGTSRRFNEAWTRYHGKKPSRTIDTGHRNHFHYKWDRVPTVRENARLQTFPDTFRIYGSKTSQNKQVGNAVPYMLARVLAEEISKTLQ